MLNRVRSRAQLRAIFAKLREVRNRIAYDFLSRRTLLSSVKGDLLKSLVPESVKTSFDPALLKPVTEQPFFSSGAVRTVIKRKGIRIRTAPVPLGSVFFMENLPELTQRLTQVSPNIQPLVALAYGQPGEAQKLMRKLIKRDLGEYIIRKTSDVPLPPKIGVVPSKTVPGGYRFDIDYGSFLPERFRKALPITVEPTLERGWDAFVRAVNVDVRRFLRKYQKPLARKMQSILFGDPRPPDFVGLYHILPKKPTDRVIVRRYPGSSIPFIIPPDLREKYLLWALDPKRKRGLLGPIEERVNRIVIDAKARRVLRGWVKKLADTGLIKGLYPLDKLRRERRRYLKHQFYLLSGRSPEYYGRFLKTLYKRHPATRYAPYAAFQKSSQEPE